MINFIGNDDVYVNRFEWNIFFGKYEGNENLEKNFL